MRKDEHYDIVIPMHQLHVVAAPTSKHARLKRTNEPRAVINVLFLAGDRTPTPEQIIDIDQPTCTGAIGKGVSEVE